MLTLQVSDIKDFMSKLLISDLFHDWRVKELSITTYNTFQIDGLIHKDFYSSDEPEAVAQNPEEYSSWTELKPFCFAVIKGNKSPLRFRFVFCLGRVQIQQFLAAAGLSFKAEDIGGLYLHCLYENSVLHCTTGTSMNIFTMDKSLDHTWDDYVQEFFKKSQILYFL